MFLTVMPKDIQLVHCIKGKEFVKTSNSLSSSTDLYKSFHGWKACTDVTREKYAERILIKEKMDKQKAARKEYHLAKKGGK